MDQPDPKFLGHAPVSGPRVVVWIEYWYYSFEGDWQAVADETIRTFQENGYELIPYLDPNAGFWRENAIKLRRGDYKVRGIPVQEDSVTLVKDCRLKDARDWSKIGPEMDRDSGWIAALLALPKPVII